MGNYRPVKGDGACSCRNVGLLMFKGKHRPIVSLEIVQFLNITPTL